MPRVTHHSWWCGTCGSRNTSHNRQCIKCANNRFEKYANVRASDRAVVYYNPITGEHRTPPRADQPIPEVYARQGFERKEIENISKWEKEAGVVHEATNFTAGSEPSAERYGVPKVDKAAVINDIRDAIASGPWTGVDNILNSTNSESD
jgi:hypothetical protein